MNQSGLNTSCFGLKTIVFERNTRVVITAIGVSVFNVIFALTATLGNGLMLHILTTKPCLRTPSNLLLSSLCVTDFLVGLVVQPLHVVSRIYEVHNVHLCTVKLVYAYFAFLCSGASFLNVSLIGLDRFYAVCYPFRYAARASTKRYTVVVATVWLLWAGLTALPFVGAIAPGQYSMVLTVSGALAIAVIIACYSAIYRVTRQHRKKISNAPSLGTFTNEVRSQRVKEHRRSNTMAIIILVLFACYLPNLVCSMLESIVGFNLDLAYVAWHWTGLLVFFNSSLNPVLYCIRNKDIRNSVIREIRRRQTFDP